MEILKCEGVRKVYGSKENLVTALDGIDLSVEKGEFVAIVGASGSGKSTMLHILGSVDKPTAGKVLVDGEDISKLNPTKSAIFRRRKVGLVYQFYNLIPTLTVRKNILMPLLLDKRKVNEEYFEQVVNQLGIADKLEMMPSQLSGGQQQRVAIARALATDPEIIYFDEPTSALDPELIGEVLSVMRDLANEGMTMLVVTHEMNFARQVSNRIFFMDEGRIIEDTDSESFFRNPKQERTREFLDSMLRQHEA